MTPQRVAVRWIGFVFPGRDTYREGEAEDAWNRQLGFLERNLGRGARRAP